MTGNRLTGWTASVAARALALSGAVAVAVILILVQESSAATADSPGGAPGDRAYVEGELIVAYSAQASAEDKQNIRAAVGAELVEGLPGPDSELLSFPEAKNEAVTSVGDEVLQQKKLRLEREPEVRYVNYDYLGHTSAAWIPNDPLFKDHPDFDPDQWGLYSAQVPDTSVQARDAWGITRGTGVRVAVLDSGIRASHRDFEKKIAAQRDLVNRDATAQDDTGHGTRVAGIVAARTNNGRGVAGMCPGCRLLVGKVVAKNGTARSTDIVKGIDWAIQQKAKVINISIAISSAGPGEIDSLNTAVQRAVDRGVVVVAGSGNTGDETAVYPAAYEPVVSVGGTNIEGKRDTHSTYGPTLDVMAPGEVILSTHSDGGYGYGSGTSFAAPHVAGLAALLKYQGCSYNEVIDKIQETADPLLDPADRDMDGHGLINAKDATLAASKPSPEGCT